MGDPPPIRVAVCDDIADFRTVLRIFIDVQPDMSFVGAAANGAQAVTLVASARPDVLLLDVTMPVLDGLSALPRILTLHPQLRVVMMSGLSDPHLERAAKAAGAAAWVVKGAMMDQLLSAIRAERAYTGPAPSANRVGNAAAM